MANSPPGCSDKKLVTFSTSPATTTQQSLLLVCLATSSKVYPPPPPPLFFFSFFFFAPAPSALFMLSSYEPPENFELSTAPDSPPPESVMSEVSLTPAPSMYFAQCLPATRPNTTQSSKEFPPRRLLPCTPPATSPAA